MTIDQRLKAVIIAVSVVLIAMLGLHVLQNAMRWSDRGCNMTSSVAYAVTRGGPGSTQYCEPGR